MRGKDQVCDSFLKKNKEKNCCHVLSLVTNVEKVLVVYVKHVTHTVHFEYIISGYIYVSPKPFYAIATLLRATVLGQMRVYYVHPPKSYKSFCTSLLWEASMPGEALHIAIMVSM